MNVFSGFPSINKENYMDINEYYFLKWLRFCCDLSPCPTNSIHLDLCFECGTLYENAPPDQLYNEKCEKCFSEELDRDSLYVNYIRKFRDNYRKWGDDISDDIYTNYMLYKYKVPLSAKNNKNPLCFNCGITFSGGYKGDKFSFFCSEKCCENYKQKKDEEKLKYEEEFEDDTD